MKCINSEGKLETIKPIHKANYKQLEKVWRDKGYVHAAIFAKNRIRGKRHVSPNSGGS